MRLVSCVPALLCAVLTLIPAHGESTQQYRFDRMWPLLQQPWYFSEHNGLALDPAGNIYVVNAGNSTVSKFGADGNFVLSWGGEGDDVAQLATPSGIAVDSDGTVWIADTGNHRVQHFSSAGTYLGGWGNQGGGVGEFYSPRGIAISTAGNVYVSDTFNHRIQVFNREGNAIVQWGREGGGPGEFRFQRGIALGSDGEVYVADKFNHRISVFDWDGTFIRSWGSLGQDPGQFLEPLAVATDTVGRVYVSDTENHRIQVFGSEGQFLYQWGDKGQGPGQFFSPRGIAIGSSGTVHVADFWNDRIQLFTSEGIFKSQWGSLSDQPGRFFAPVGIAIDEAGAIYVSDTWNNRVQKFDGRGTVLKLWGVEGDGPGEFARPHGIAADGAGNVFVCDTFNNRIQKFSSEGVFLLGWSQTGLGQPQLVQPIAVACGPENRVYVTDGERGNFDRITEFTDEGVFVRSWGVSGSKQGELDDARGIAIAPDGSVLVAEYGNSRIQRFSPFGVSLGMWGSAGTGENEFSRLWGIAVDSAGTVYACDAGNDRIQRFSLDGTFDGTVGRSGTAPGTLGYPTGVAVARNGSLHVVEESNSRIQILKPVTIPVNAKAVVVAAGGPFPGNQLWDTTQFCANFAMRALAHQGFRNEDVCYLTSDSDLDLDNNGQPDDVDGDVTNTNLARAFTEWATGADSLVVYLVDHGGTDTFRMSRNEVLSAGDLGAWLDEADAGISGRITVIYDACQSGSFLEELEGPNRIVVTSSDAEESAYFLSTGTISFSNFFWTHVFNGFSVGDAFAVATDAIGQSIGFQTPQLRDPNNLAATTFIGNGTEIIGEAPRIVAATNNQPLTGSAGMDLFAEIDDADGISRAWAVVRPPNFAAPSPDNPVQNLPVVELQPIAQDAARWEGRYDGFTHEGVYRLSFYSRDAIGNTSLPVQRTITVGDPLYRRAILLGGGAGRDITTEAVEESLRIAYNALVSQGYGDDDIRIYAPTTFSTGGENPHPVELNLLENLDFALGEWLGDSTQDLLVYAAGDGDTGALVLNEGQVLTAEDLAARLQGTQERLSGVLSVVLDSPRSGSFLPALAAPAAQRIVIASAAADQDVCMAPQRSISFSNYFWRRVLNGANVSEAFTHAALAMSFAAMGQSAEMDDDGDGVYATASDGLLAGRYSIGSGILLAGDDPIIGQVSDPLLLDGETAATIWADQVTTTGAIASVFAVIQLPPASVGSKAVSCGERPVEVVELHALNGRYEGEFNGIYYEGAYDINIVAIDDDGAVSLPEQTQIVQMQSSEGPIDPDGFEDDDTPDSASNIIVDGPAQSHNFHDSGDEDWAVFVVAADQILTLRTEGLGSAGDTLLELFAGDGEFLLASNDDRGPQDPSSEIRYSVMEDGLLYARIRHAGGIFGAGTEYDLHVLREAGPSSAGGIVGAVIARETQEPVGGAVVQVRNRSDAGSSVVEIRTGDNGEFVILQLESGSYAMNVLGGDMYETASRDSLDLSAGALLEVDFELVVKGAGGGTNPSGCGPSDRNSATRGTQLPGDLLLVGMLLLLLGVRNWSVLLKISGPT